MIYPGNRSLSSNVQERILGTFEQTLDLASEGNRQEALLGCDFVLRMDPLFEPARRLQERLHAGNGAVRVEDLRLGADGAAPVEDALAEPAEDLFGDLEGLDFDLPDLPQAESSLRDELQALFDARQLKEVVRLAERHGETVAVEPQLRGIVENAQARIEAEPYVQKFLAAARRAREAGQADEADKLLDKARSLDPTHPGLPENAGPEALPAAGPAAGGFGAPPLELPLATARVFASPAGGASLDLAGGDSESERRIAELLHEGQAAFDRADYQAAVDAWSRIFLIDIDHQEAARRIEQARKLKAEHERQVEEIFHDGVASLEAGDPAAARASFERVLGMQPGHLAAREYLQQIDSGTLPPPRPAAAAALGGEAALSLPHLGGMEPGDLKEEILVPPEPGQAPARSAERRPPTVAAARGGPGLTFIAIGGGVLVVVLVAVWFAVQNWDRWFPNSTTDEQAAAPAAPGPDPIARAVKLHEQGKTLIALNQLRRVPSTDPTYEEAQALISQWEAETAPAFAQEAGPSPEQAERRERLLEAARRAHADRHYLRAVERFEQAAAIAPLAEGDGALQADIRSRLEPLSREIEYFRQHEWELVLPDLWRLHESDPGNPVVSQLLVDSYYNLGVQDLQQGDPVKAVDKFGEGLAIAPDDGILRRHYLFAQTYQERPQDLLYRIYVKYLPFR